MYSGYFKSQQIFSKAFVDMGSPFFYREGNSRYFNEILRQREITVSFKNANRHPLCRLQQKNHKTIWYFNRRLLITGLAYPISHGLNLSKRN